MNPIEICVFYDTNKNGMVIQHEYTDWLGYSVTLGMKNGKNVIVWTLDSAYEDEHFDLTVEQLNFLERFKNVLSDSLMQFMSNPDNKNESYYSLPDSELEKIFKIMNNASDLKNIV